MFCPECGKFNPDENQVCQYCNSLLIDNSAPVSTEQSAEAPAPQTAGEGSNDVVLNIPKLDLAKAKSFFMKNKFIIIPILAVVIAFIIFVSVGSSMSSPEKVVRNYYNALVNGEYEDMYDYIALPEGDFTTKENFVKHMKAINKDDNSLPKQTDFRVEEIRDNINNFENGMSASTEKEKNDSPLKKYTVTFYDKSTGATDSYTVTLIEQDTKKLLFFKDYKVSSAGLIVKNVQFEIAGDAQIKIDGKTLKNPKKNEDGKVCGIKSVKEAVSGTTLADVDESSYVARLKKIDKNIAFDLFICQLSTNDAVPSRNIELYKTEQAIRFILEYVKNTFDCPIVFYTGTYFENEKYEKLINLLYDLQKEYDFYILDFFNDKDMLSVSEEDYKRYMNDPIHPTIIGYKEWWTPKFIDFCKQL